MRFILSAIIFVAAGVGYLKYKDHPAGADALGGYFSQQELPPDPEIQMEALAEAGPELYAVSGPKVQNFAEIIRFDLTPNHVMERWQQLSAGLSELNLQGYRVPLVTGIDQTDLAGSLTYYFDPRQQMRRITFVGTTGNPRRLSDFLVQQYGFRRVVNQDPRRESYARAGGKGGYCSITPSEVLDRHAAQTNFMVEFRINR